MKRARRPETLRPLVRDILRRVGVDRPPVSVEKIALHLGADVRRSPFSKGELAGMLYRDSNQLVIGVNSSHQSNRQRFTIAHEIGHLVLHEEGVFIDHDFSVQRRDENSSLAIDASEIEANRFAAELLMPYDFLVVDLAGCNIDIEDERLIKRLAKKYAVSEQAMTFRLNNVLGL